MEAVCRKFAPKAKITQKNNENNQYKEESKLL